MVEASPLRRRMIEDIDYPQPLAGDTTVLCNIGALTHLGGILDPYNFRFF